MTPERTPRTHAATLLLSVVACTQDTASPDTTTDTALPTPAELTRGGNSIAGAHGLAMDDAGVLYVADTFTNQAATSRIYRIPPPYDGPLEETEITGGALAGLLWHAGALHVCDVQSGGVAVYSEDLTLQHGRNAAPSWNLDAGADGGLWAVSYDGQVLRTSETGAPEQVLSGLEAPFDLVVRPEGIWVSEQISAAEDGRVALYDTDGALVRALDWDWSNPEGIAFDDAGHLWVADTGAGQLLRFDGEHGTLLQKLDVPGLPINLAPDLDGGLLVGVTGNDPSWWRLTFP